MGSIFGVRRVMSKKELDPESPFSASASPQGAEPLLKRSISGSFSAPELAQLRSYQEAHGSRHARRSSAVRHWQQLAVAFFSGSVLTVICTGHLSITGLLPSVQRPPVLDPPLADASLPPALGLSPMAMRNLTGNGDVVVDRLIVAARHHEDTSWLDTYLSEIPHVVYQVDEANATHGAQHRSLANKGNEAMAYLQFIVDYYDRLPKHTLFIHGHRGTWHIKDHVPVIRRLRWGALPFGNLRYRNGPGNRMHWSCGNFTADPHFQAFHCDWVGNYVWLTGMQPRQGAVITPMNKDEWIDSVELQSVWQQVFQAELGPPPEKVHGPCCAEFVVARERILAHPKSFYVHMRDWIVNTELDRYRSGRVFEYMWHIMFGEPPVLQPVEECALLTCSPADELEAAKPTPFHAFSDGDTGRR